MVLSTKELVRRIKPETTALLFGAGASIPSGAPSAIELVNEMSSILDENLTTYSFNEAAELFEIKRTRKELVSLIEEKLKNLYPIGVNSPAFPRHLAGSVSAALQSQWVTASRC